MLVPVCSYLFWTEWGQYPRIERSRLDGTQRLVLVNVSISWPNGISIDYEVWTTADVRALKIFLNTSVIVNNFCVHLSKCNCFIGQLSVMQ